MAQIVCIGTSCMDVFLPKLTEAPKPGMRVVSNTPIRFAPGGNATNAAICYAQMRNHVFLVSKFGNRGTGKYIQQELETGGIQFDPKVSIVDTEGRGNDHSGVSYVIPEVRRWLAPVEHKVSLTQELAIRVGRQPAFVHYAGVNRELSVKDIRDAAERNPGVFDQADVLHIGDTGSLCGLDSAELGEFVGELKRGNPHLLVLVDLNLVINAGAGVFDADIRSLLPHITVLAGNEMEFRHLAEGSDVTGRSEHVETSHWDVLARLHDAYGQSIPYLCMKRDQEGCAILANGAGRIEQPAFRRPGENIWDVTGAGDAWCVGFIMGLIGRQSTEECARTANGLACMSLYNFGCSFELKPRRHTPEGAVDRIAEFISSAECQVDRS